MKLIEDWRAELNRRWNIKAATLLVWLGVLEQALPALQQVIPPILYALLAVAVIVAQMYRQKPKPDPDATIT